VVYGTSLVLHLSQTCTFNAIHGRGARHDKELEVGMGIDVYRGRDDLARANAGGARREAEGQAAGGEAQTALP